jgi:hypothetical protein
VYVRLGYWLLLLVASYRSRICTTGPEYGFEPRDEMMLCTASQYVHVDDRWVQRLRVNRSKEKDVESINVICPIGVPYKYVDGYKTCLR